MADLHARIRAALAAREGALAAWRHSPNSSNATALRDAHRQLDARLEQLWAVLLPHERAAVDARAIRVMESV